MVQLKILTGKQSGTDWTASEFPVVIGRGSAADLSVDEPGVWDRHCEIAFSPDGFSVEAQPNALVTINGEKVDKTVLRNGDVIEMGALKLRFGLAPVLQRSLFPREIATWLSLVMLCLGQIALIYRLIR